MALSVLYIDSGGGFFGGGELLENFKFYTKHLFFFMMQPRDQDTYKITIFILFFHFNVNTVWLKHWRVLREVGGFTQTDDHNG